MRRQVAVLALVTSLLAVSPVRAQEATPSASPSAAGALLRLTLDELPPSNVAKIGVTRVTFALAGGLRMTAGSGPTVFFVETGTLAVWGAADLPMLAVRAAGTPGTLSAGGEVDLRAGDAQVLPVGATAQIRNDGATPAVALDLLEASDAHTEAETGISRAVLASRQATLPAAPVVMSLARATIAPGEHFPVPPAPVETVLATVERAQTFLLSGEGINRGTRPMQVYVLTIAPDTDPNGTPAASQ
jgi:hypothetical protein